MRVTLTITNRNWKLAMLLCFIITLAGFGAMFTTATTNAPSATAAVAGWVMGVGSVGLVLCGVVPWLRERVRRKRAR